MSQSKLRMSTPCRRFGLKRDVVSQNGPLDFIDAVNKLQDKLAGSANSLDISLPQIVVVGGQSAGKSSVLENIVGREFLPRGSGVVTRRPTIVQLLPCEEEYAMFLHLPGVKFTSFEDVRNEISKETNRNPGPEGFSSVPISLKIYSPKVLKLTLVDLPGLIRVTVDNQSEDSIEEIRDMVLQYILQPNCLILAVSPANQDIASSDALEIAKIADPQRIRTIGVLTKLDLMDEGTDAVDILENIKIPLARGYIGVLNRSQKDIEEGRDFAYCIDKEEKFFANMPCYRNMADRMGTAYLKKKLNEELYSHIKEYLPIVRKELREKLAEIQKELRNINGRVSFDITDSSSIQDYMIKLTQMFIEHFQIEIFGYSVLVSMDELSAGTMISFKLRKSIQNLKLPEVPDQKKLLTLIANMSAARICMSMSSLSLETVFTHLLSAHIDPLKLLVDDIGDILYSAVDKSSKLLCHYPSFKKELNFLVTNFISESTVETKETLEKHLECEMYFVNTGHKDFTFPNFDVAESFPINLWQNSSNVSVSSGETSDAFIGSSSAPYSEKEKDSDHTEAMRSIEADKCAIANANVLSKAIERYIIVQQKHIENAVFKYILFFLVKRVVDFVKNDLFVKMLQSVDEEVICRDCEKDFIRMRELENTCELLEDALNAVQSF